MSTYLNVRPLGFTDKKRSDFESYMIAKLVVYGKESFSLAPYVQSKKSKESA